VILRKPELTKADCEFIAWCYEVWPDSRKGPVFPSDVRNWIKGYDRWLEQGLIAVSDGIPVGFILYAQNFFVAAVYEIVVAAEHQGKGYASQMWRALQDQLASEGVVVAEFEALPGVVSDLVSTGRFQKIGEGEGTHTGLPTIKARVTADMNV